VALMGSPAFCTAAMARRTLASVKARGFATTVCFTIEKSAYGVLCGRGPSRLGSESVFGGAPGAISAKERHHWVGRSRVRGDHSATPRNEPVYRPEFEDWLCTEASSGPLSQRTKLARPQSRLPCRKPLQLRSSDIVFANPNHQNQQRRWWKSRRHDGGTAQVPVRHRLIAVRGSHESCFRQRAPD
jgi:hypothetical protein